MPVNPLPGGDSPVGSGGEILTGYDHGGTGSGSAGTLGVKVTPSYSPVDKSPVAPVTNVKISNSDVNFTYQPPAGSGASGSGSNINGGSVFQEYDQDRVNPAEASVITKWWPALVVLILWLIFGKRK